MTAKKTFKSPDGLDVTDKGKVHPTLKNLKRVLSVAGGLKDGFAYNELSQRPVLTRDVDFLNDGDWKNGTTEIDIDDERLIQLRVWLAEEVAQFSKENIVDATFATAYENRFNPVHKYLDMCMKNWDGVERLDNWLFDLCGATFHDNEDITEEEERDYIKAVGSAWMISACARAVNAGCKVDTLLILEGLQGKRKSFFIDELANGWATELLVSVNRKKDALDQIMGKWIVEIPELKALKGDKDGNKGFITLRADRERLSYNKFAKDYRRRCVFIGTTNETQYFKDDTGNRRYWPVLVTKCDIEELKKVRDHLWGEAFIRYLKNERWYFDDEIESEKKILDTAEKIQGAKLEVDGMTQAVSDYAMDHKRVSTLEIWTNVFEGAKTGFDDKQQRRVAAILKSIGFERRKVKVAGKAKWMFVLA